MNLFSSAPSQHAQGFKASMAEMVSLAALISLKLESFLSLNTLLHSQPVAAAACSGFSIILWFLNSTL